MEGKKNQVSESSKLAELFQLNTDQNYDKWVDVCRMGDAICSELESESIEIIREVVATATQPVMLYSMGKDSSVMLRLAQKAFYPASIPFPLMHIDTGWKFREMIAFRDRMTKQVGFELITYTNLRGAAEGIGPITHDVLGKVWDVSLLVIEVLRQRLDQKIELVVTHAEAQCVLNCLDKIERPILAETAE